MNFNKQLIEGTLIKRYKRFLADIELIDGTTVTAHTPNTGSMKGCAQPGSRVWLRDTADSKRKYPLSWELVEALPGILVGVNTMLPNTLVREAIEAGVVRKLLGYKDIRHEVRYGRENSRIDLLLKDDMDRLCYVEVKNVTLAEDGTALFPDAVSQRGTKHLRELAAAASQGHRGVIFYCVQRADVRQVQPADRIDPVYGETLRWALAQGVEAIAYRANVTTTAIELHKELPVVCP